MSLERTVSLDGLDLAFSVRAESALLLELASRLDDYGLVLGPARERPHVRLHHAGTRVGKPSPDARPVRVFSRSYALLDERSDRRTYWASSERTPTYELRLDAGAPDCDLSIAAADFPLVTTYLFREALHSYLRSCGALALHAGAITGEDGRTWVVAGSKGAGKTTAVLELCCRGGHAFTANDRCYVLPNGLVVGMPLTLRLTRFTLQRFPGIGDAVRQAPGDDKWLLSPGRLRAAYGAGLAASGALAGVLLPGPCRMTGPLVMDHVVQPGDDPLFEHARFTFAGTTGDPGQVAGVLLAAPSRWLPWRSLRGAESRLAGGRADRWEDVAAWRES